jgi:hypothetical protein
LEFGTIPVVARGDLGEIVAKMDRRVKPSWPKVVLAKSAPLTKRYQANSGTFETMINLVTQTNTNLTINTRILSFISQEPPSHPLKSMSSFNLREAEKAARRHAQQRNLVEKSIADDQFFWHTVANLYQNYDHKQGPPR